MNSIQIKLNGQELEMTGVLTFDTTPVALAQILRLLPSSGEVVLNFSGIGQSDSSALTLITELMRLSRKKGFQFKISNVPTKLLEVARVSGLDGMIPIKRES